MKRVKLSILLIIMVMMGSNVVLAQDEITDLDLRKYAILTQAVEFMKKDISIELNGMIKAQEGMTGQRYKELAATDGDEAKLAEIGAKEYEIQFLELVNQLKEERIESIKMVNSELATKMVGDKGKMYKSIKAGLDTDPELKARFDAILAQVAGE